VVTRVIEPDIGRTLLHALEIRDAKGRFLSGALVLFVVGFGLYCFAIAQLLLAARPG
jgi:hypothetical protein